MEALHLAQLDTVIHRLSPLTKLFIMLLYWGTALFTFNIPVLLVLIIVEPWLRGPGARMLLVAVALVIAGAFAWHLLRRGGQERSVHGSAPAAVVRQDSPTRIAVLPLVNLSGDAAQEYFSDGMTEEITSRLSRLAGLAVTSRTSATQYKGSPRSAREIGAELAVAYLVEGSVRRAGDRIRVTASLVRTGDAVRLWSEDLDARFDDVFSVQERIASRIVEALGVTLSPREERALRSWGTRNVAAYDAYLKGMAKFTEDPDVRANVDAATVHFERAIAIDAEFAPALAGLASCEAMVYRNWDSLPARLRRAEALAGKALALDPQLVPALKAAADEAASVPTLEEPLTEDGSYFLRIPISWIRSEVLLNTEQSIGPGSRAAEPQDCRQ